MPLQRKQSDPKSQHENLLHYTRWGIEVPRGDKDVCCVALVLEHSSPSLFVPFSPQMVETLRHHALHTDAAVLAVLMHGAGVPVFIRS